MSDYKEKEAQTKEINIAKRIIEKIKSLNFLNETKQEGKDSLLTFCPIIYFSIVPCITILPLFICSDEAMAGQTQITTDLFPVKV